MALGRRGGPDQFEMLRRVSKLDTGFDVVA